MSKTIEIVAGPNGRGDFQMRISSERRSAELHKALTQIPSWVKEKERRYKKQKALAERVFGDVVRQIEKGR